MRVYKIKGFARFQRRERIPDKALAGAVHAAEEGRIDADLGNGLIKQRVARTGQGKRGGYRTLVAYRSATRSVFLLGFAKNERDNIDEVELRDWRAASRGVLAMNDDMIRQEVTAGEMIEVEYGEDN